MRPCPCVEGAAQQTAVLGFGGAAGAQEAAPPFSQPSSGHPGPIGENSTVRPAQGQAQPRECQKPLPEEPSLVPSVFTGLPLIYWEPWASRSPSPVSLTPTEGMFGLSHLDGPCDAVFKESIWNALGLLLVISR